MTEMSERDALITCAEALLLSRPWVESCARGFSGSDKAAKALELLDIALKQAREVLAGVEATK